MYYKLCYICDDTAFFTIKELKDQWGDDWNDTPYEHNAEEPYFDNSKDIIKIKFECDELLLPCERFNGRNSPYSVEQINTESIPWLCGYYGENPIYPGTDIEDFINMIYKLDGKIYVELDNSNNDLKNK